MIIVITALTVTEALCDQIICVVTSLVNIPAMNKLFLFGIGEQFFWLCFTVKCGVPRLF